MKTVKITCTALLTAGALLGAAGSAIAGTTRVDNANVYVYNYATAETLVKVHFATDHEVVVDAGNYYPGGGNHIVNSNDNDPNQYGNGQQAFSVSPTPSKPGHAAA